VQFHCASRFRGAACFAVYDEGNGTRSLYLTPTSARELGAALYSVALGNQLAVLTPLPAPAGCTPLPGGGWLGPGRAILGLREPVQIAVVGPQATAESIGRAMPGSILASPQHALPDVLGARVALDAEASGHAIVLSKETGILAACLETVLERCVEQGLGRLAPRIPPSALETLLEPIAPGQWHRAWTHDAGRYHVLKIETATAGQVLDRRSWVANLQGAQWNAGWTI
jgi:hypothetical protein